ncbi:MAG: hypothetical protein AB4911_18920 [Oscillochloridaceae bacterium umkhey_bin13]
MHKLLRLGAFLGVLLLLTVLMPSRSALALTINVDGNPADWGPVVALGSSGSGGGVNAFYYTSSNGILYLRFDPTATFSSSTFLVRLGNGTTDYRISYNGTSALVLNTCAGLITGPCSASGPATTTFAAASETVIEIAIDFAALGLSDNLYVRSFGINGALGGVPTVTPLGLPGPLSVELASFTASHTAAGVELAWETASEREIAGFNLLRSTTGSLNDAVALNADLIEGGGDALSGGSYSFTDLTPVAGASYWLQVVNADSTTEEYGPVTPAAVTASNSRVFIPLVRR